VLALDIQPDDAPEDSLMQAREAMAALNTPEVLLLSDVFGATPCNVAQRLTDRRRIRVVTGVNVPMLWRVLCYGQEGAERLAERAISGATQGVMAVEVRAPQYQEPRNHHGQDRHHDQ
jgi:PTS system ascorbate-specific IIA component